MQGAMNKLHTEEKKAEPKKEPEKPKTEPEKTAEPKKKSVLGSLFGKK
jgi:hypothetical protein